MPKKEPAAAQPSFPPSKTFDVVCGFNAPDPTGKRLENGRKAEVRFEIGDQITPASVTPQALATLIEQRIVIDRDAEKAAAKKSADETAAPMEPGEGARD